MTHLPLRTTCHCGAVELAIDMDIDPATAARCDCGFCRRRAAPNVTVPLDKLWIVKGQEALTLYTWGTGTAQHYFCRHCGIYTHHQRRADTSVYGVNLGTFDGINPADHEPFPWHDGVNHPSDQ